jgi:hypothetical protein
MLFVKKKKKKKKSKNPTSVPFATSLCHISIIKNNDNNNNNNERSPHTQGVESPLLYIFLKNKIK